MIRLLVEEGCENPEESKDILMPRVVQKIKDGVIDIEIFN